MASITTTPQSIVIDQKLATFSQEHQQKQQQQQNNNQQEPLRCPRCDSSNTKFCYYNNYSLSQPRHFCKACKRYWTRGGTLRTVPVGGGYRKNKRVIKRPLNINNNISSTTTSNTTTLSNYNPNIGESSVNSLFYGMSNNNNLIDFPFSRYDIHNLPQFNGLGLGLVHSNNNNNNNKHIFHDLISSSNPLLSTNNNNNDNNNPSITSLFASSFQMKGGANNFETIMPSYEGMFMKDVKMEIEGQNRKMDHYWSGPSQGHMDHNMGSSSSNDPYVVWGSGPNLGPWLNPNNNANLGSSFSSLI